MFEIKTLKDGLKKIAPRTKTKAITDDDNKNLDTILSEKANSTDIPSKVSQLTNDTGFITNTALANYPNNTQMNAAINSHHDSTKQDKLAAQTPYTNVGSKSKIPKITTNTLGQVTNVEEVDIEAQQANLSQNLAYANNNDSSIVRHVSSDIVINSTDSSIYHKLIKTIYEINNGIENEIITPLAYFNKKYFSNNDNVFSLNINNIISNALLLNGSNILYNPVSNLNNFSTGIGLFRDGENLPFTVTSLIISGSHQKNNALIQLALSYEGNIKYRVYDIDKNVWKEWISLFIDNLSSSNNYRGLSANQGRILNEKITTEANRANGAETILTTDLTNEVTRAKAKENELNDKIESTNLEYNIYEGEDLIIKYADEIAKYSDEWAWIKARIKAANFKGLRIHDYIPVKCSNNKVLRMEIGGIDTYYHNGSPEVGHHIDFISKECWDVTVQYNKVDINNGTAVQVVPFMASNLKKFLMSEAGPVPNSTTDMSVTTEVDYTNDGIWHFLPDKLKNVIVEKSFFKVNRYTEGSIITTDNTKWEWFNLSKLWLPTEKEVYGSSVYEGNGASYGVFGRQYPCFIGHSRFKGIVGNINARCYWWLLSPYYGNSTSFCNMDSGGNAGSNPASGTHVRVPVCFRVA